MHNNLKESHSRSLLKGISWRIIGTIDTMVISRIISSSAKHATGIGVSELFTKIILYYFHERLWQLIPLGKVRKIIPIETELINTVKTKESHTRSIIKGISWRVLGTIDTTIISFFWTGSWNMAFKIAGTEVFTKLILYYIHERLWQKVPRSGLRNFFKKKLGINIK